MKFRPVKGGVQFSSLTGKDDFHIFLSPAAHQKLAKLTEFAPQEVSVLGKVQRDGFTFLVEDVYIFEQKVHHTETKLSQDDLALFFDVVLNAEGGEDEVGKYRFWYHSHVNGDTNPSGTYCESAYGDLSTVYDLLDSCDFLIMAIGNKRGDLRMEVFLPDLDLRVQNVPWSIAIPEDPAVDAFIEQEYADKVTLVAPHYFAQRSRWPVVCVEGADDDSEEDVDIYEEEGML